MDDVTTVISWGRAVKWGVSAALVLALGSWSTDACAARPGPKAEMGVRTGYGVPIGKLHGGSDQNLSAAIGGQVPLWFDLGIRVTPSFSVGGFFSYGLGWAGSLYDSSCDAARRAGGTCDAWARDLRFGLQFQHHLTSPGSNADFWYGLGVGYEILQVGATLTQGTQSVEVQETASGYELIDIQFGVDFRLSDKWALGPFATIAGTEYSRAKQTCFGTCSADIAHRNIDIRDRDFHFWTFLGARVTVLP